MGEHASMYPLLCVGGFAEDVTVSADDDDEDDVTNRQIRITVVAAGRMPQNWSPRSSRIEPT